MTLQEIHAALRAKRAKRGQLLDEYAALGDGAGADERRGNVARGVQKLDQEISGLELQERQGREDRVRAGAATAGDRRDNGEIYDTADRPASRPSVGDASPNLSAALRAIDRHADVLTTTQANHLERVARKDRFGADAGYLAKIGADDYASGFFKYIEDPTTAGIRLSAGEQRAMQEALEAGRLQAGFGLGGGFQAAGIGLGSQGGSLPLPFALDPTVMPSSDGEIEPISRLARTVTITGTNTWQGVRSDGVTSNYDSEASAVNDDSPTLVQPEITAERWTSFVPISFELFADWSGAQAELSKMFQDAKAVEDATQFLSGSGTAEPLGILAGSSTAVAVATGSTALDADDFYSVKNELPPRFRPRSQWVMAGEIIDRAARLVPYGSVDDVPLVPADRSTVVGRPVSEWSTMASTVTSGDKIAILADFQAAFVIVQRLGVRVEVVSHLADPSTGFPTGQRGLLAWGRTGSGVVVENALRYLVMT